MSERIPLQVVPFGGYWSDDKPRPLEVTQAVLEGEARLQDSPPSTWAHLPAQRQLSSNDVVLRQPDLRTDSRYA